MAFHYYLLFSKRGYRGDEPFFEPIRSFIRAGGEWREFVKLNPGSFRFPFGRTALGGAILPTFWCHLLAVDESQSEITVCVCLLAGPETLGQVRTVRLGITPTSIHIPSGVWGNIFVYDENAKPCAGFMGTLNISHLQ